MLPKPSGIYIQTINKCNARCTICPQNKAQKEFGEQVMSDEIFYDLINQIGFDYSGLIAPFLMFEPLVDERIFDFIKYIKKHCPYATVEISTNGSLLDKEKANRLVETGIDRVHFNVGGATKKIYEKRMGLDFEQTISNIKYFKSLFKNVFINFVLYKDNEKEKDEIKRLFPNYNITNNFYASNRGGNVNIKHDRLTRFTNCNLQNTDMYIVSNGNVIQCCNDYMRESVYGNIRTEKLWNIWNNKPINYNLRICKKCL